MIEVIYFLFIFISVFCLGQKIISKLGLNINFLESVVFSSAIGFGIFSYIAFFLGVVGLLYKSIFISLITLILILSKKELKYFFSGIKIIFRKIKSLKGLNFVLMVVFLFFVVLNIIASLAPPYLWDEVFYNLAIPKIYARHHEIVTSFDNFRAFFPFNINLLFTIGILIKNGILGKLFMFAYGTLLAIAIFTFTLRYFSLRAALFATLAYYTMPMVSNHIGSAYIDIGVAFYIFLALYTFLIWIYSNNIKWFYLSAVMSGLSIASKHTALLYLPIIGLAIIYKSFFKDRKGLLPFLKQSLTYFLIIFLLASPWYIRSYFATGNPIWPFAYSLFGGVFWDQTMTNANLDLSLYLTSVSKPSILSYLTLLWDITMHSSNYVMLLGFGPIFLAFIPLLVFMKKIKKITIYLLIYSLIFTTIWFFWAQVLRYLMVYPVLAIVSGTVIESLLKVKSLKKIILFLLILSLSFNLLLWYGANSKKLPYVFGLESEKEFYLKLNDHNGYVVFDYINKNLPKNSKLMLFREVRGYLSNVDYIITPETGQKVVDYNLIKDSDELYQRLKELKITHVLVNTKVELFQPDIKITNAPPFFSKRVADIMEQVLNEHSALIFEDKGVFLYSLK